MIQRYEIAIDRHNGNIPVMVKNEGGRWVPHSDHVAAIAEKDAEIQRLREEIERIATIIE